MPLRDLGAVSISELVVYWNSAMNRSDNPTDMYRQRSRAYVEAAGA
jgi:hypothetical protein